MKSSTMIRVISLAKDVERRTQFVTRSGGTDLSWKFFDAHEDLSHSLVYDGDLAAIRRGRFLSPGELGCYSSHYGAWEEFLKSDSQQLAVLEDDAWVDWDYLKRLLEHDLSASGIDYLKLSITNLPPRILKGRLAGRYVAHFLGYPQGTVGYVLSRKGAQRLLEHCRVVAGPIDIVMDQSWWGGMHPLALVPCPVVEKMGESRIGAARNSEELKLPKRLFFRRQICRIQEKIRIFAYIALARLRVVGPRTSLDRRWM